MAKSFILFILAPKKVSFTYLLRLFFVSCLIFLDINEAVDAAERAFPTWSSTSIEERAKFLNTIADEIEKRMEMLIDLEVMDMGIISIYPSKFFHIGNTVNLILTLKGKMRREIAVDMAGNNLLFSLFSF